ncbi:ribosomal protection-like ABC-F family protein [Listeria booriae]|uniref:ribosomal protection-like ABC-F family protein n=1 Tax=Listeria booriae TaxID=1552123 RepID=UPI0016259B4E|nr:ABC-F type ribosomal protection protein [Listeria booriae]MBC1513602.1 ABC-F type ribosomal protection protein [Listeria booriae]MBC6152525.1 ABC-F type ribosomal protection protein [Listeria booriae]MBC6306878.1 ABC-F type ribosomal protection protein [Listeria booriae]
MTIVALNNVTKWFTGDLILEKISLQVEEGERIGIIGRNGEGKSTILKIIARLETVDDGIVSVKRSATVGLLNQMPNVSGNAIVRDYLRTAFADVLSLQAELTELEQRLTTDMSERLLAQYGEKQARFIDLGGYNLDTNMDKILHGLGISHLAEKVWEQLSGGEQTKVSLAKMLLEEPDLLLLDEPTNHLDLQAVDWLTQFLRAYKGTVLVVSHDRYFLDEVVQKIVELENKELITYHTNFSGYLVEREERLLKEFRDYKDQQKKIKKMQQAIKRLRQWAMEANPPNDALFRRAKNMEKALARIDVLKKPALEQKNMRLEFEESKRSGEDVVIFDAVWKQFGDRVLFDGLDCHIRQKERVAIVGNNGAGKSTFLKMVLGEVAPDVGTVHVGPSVDIAYLSQHMDVGDENQTVLEAFRDKVAVVEGDARHMLATFLFYGEMVFRKVANLSGGERMRLSLAQFMNQPVNTLLLDEPTNHLDIASREVLEEALRNFEGTIITISHDRFFMNQICDRTLWLENGELVSYGGNYSYASEKRKAIVSRET